MAGLLISVRDAPEAGLALAGGADLIDVKEPRRGALGAPTRRQLAAVSRLVGGRVPLSVALGELGEPVDRRALLRTSGLAFAKVGLARAGAGWRRQWTSLIARFPSSVDPVAVAYADHVRTGSPCPSEVLAMAERLRCQAFLIDTHGKDAGRLLDFLSLGELGDLVGRAREMGIRAVVGGSLDAAAIARVLAVEPDYVAVRGAACRGGRAGRVDLQSVRRLARLVHGAEASQADPPLRA